MKTVYGSFWKGITVGKCKTKAIQRDLGISRHNQPYPLITQAYSGIFRTLCNPVLLSVVYPEPWDIQNQNHIQNRGNSTNLIYSEPRYIQNTNIFKIQGIFRTLSNIYD